MQVVVGALKVQATVLYRSRLALNVLFAHDGAIASQASETQRIRRIYVIPRCICNVNERILGDELGCAEQCFQVRPGILSCKLRLSWSKLREMGE